jgi:molecular chaperone DnaK (HSP70)
MSVLIKRNTPIPASHKKSYTTVHDYQQSVDIPIYEGERSCVDGNNLLGEFTISGIERAKKGVPKIIVNFDIDSNGILSVTVRTRTSTRTPLLLLLLLVLVVVRRRRRRWWLRGVQCWWWSWRCG